MFSVTWVPKTSENIETNFRKENSMDPTSVLGIFTFQEIISILDYMCMTLNYSDNNSGVNLQRLNEINDIVFRQTQKF